MFLIVCYSVEENLECFQKLSKEHYTFKLDGNLWKMYLVKLMISGTSAMDTIRKQIVEYFITACSEASH